MPIYLSLSKKIWNEPQDESMVCSRRRLRVQPACALLVKQPLRKYLWGSKP